MRAARVLAGRTDLLVGLGFAVAWLGEALVRDGRDLARLALDLPWAVLLLLLMVRQRRPLLVLVALAVGGACGSLVQWALGVPSGDVTVPIIGMLVAVYSLGAHASRRRLLAAPLALLPVLIADLAEGPGRAHWLPGALAFFAVFIVLLPLIAGRLVRGRGRIVGLLREQERQLVAQRAAATEAALAEDRVALAARLDEELLTGMAALAADAHRVGAVETSAPGQLVTVIEDRARALLATTRSVVVSLADERAEPGAPEAAWVEHPPPPASSGRPPRVPGEPAGLAWSALAAAALGIGLMLQVRLTPVRVPVPLALVACLALAAPLAFAWRRPLLATVAVQAAVVAFAAVVVPLPGLFAAIGLTFVPPFFVAAFAGRRGAVAGLGVCCAGQFLSAGGTELLSALPVLVLSWVAGLVLAERGRLVARLAANTELLAAGRAAALRSAVVEERARVARELHDSVGHRLTVLALHGSAARRMWNADRPRAEAAVATIAQVASEALAELQQSYAVTGAPDAEPDLAVVPDLVAGARAAGLSVALQLAGSPAAVPAGTQLGAYRVVQEALTNVLRHAPGAPVAADLRCAGGRLLVDVVNGAAAADGQDVAAPSSGTGLVGLRRRVEACGGRLEWGRQDEGGFAVRAEFPLPVVGA